MKKTWRTALIAGALALLMATPAMAGSWQADAKGYWYQNDDGSYPASCWQWVDGNGDGVAECYYFDGSGYLLVSTVTPDGCTVDGNGAWTVGGVVQTKTVAQAPATAPAQPQVPATQGSVPATGMVWLSATGEKYHKINNCGKMDPARARSISIEEATQKGYTACDKCF